MENQKTEEYVSNKKKKKEKPWKISETDKFYHTKSTKKIVIRMLTELRVIIDE